jgi:hypothetical protein
VLLRKEFLSLYPHELKAAILQAIRGKCLECSCFQPNEVRGCPVTECELWPYRLGRDPDPGPAPRMRKTSPPEGNFRCRNDRPATHPPTARSSARSMRFLPSRVGVSACQEKKTVIAAI